MTLLVWLYVAALFLLMMYALHRYWILFLYWRGNKKDKGRVNPVTMPPDWRPKVTVQLPLYNEMYVAERLIESVCAFDYPKDKLEIQILDDSTDETVEVVEKAARHYQDLGFDVRHLRRARREGFKAGALAWGLEQARGEFVAIFDADFMPPSSFLMATLPHFLDEKIGMVQTRWGHINDGYSLLTRLQALFLDGHFVLEHTARYKSGAFFNFNGTAGIWRKRTIEDAGGWSARTLTEDLDLSYRAQLAGWKFVYDQNFACPAELPVDIHAFQSQQKRWTKGALQVARHLLKDVWRAQVPLKTKVEATIHLTSNLAYILTVAVAVLLLPSVYLRQTVSAHVGQIELVVVFMMTLSIAIFYLVSQRELYSDWRWRMRHLPVLMGLGIGMCLTNAQAVLEGLFGRPSEFVRTPKYNIQNKRDKWMRKVYSANRGGSYFLPGLFAGYALLTLIVAILENQWTAVPSILIFLFGFSYVLSLSFRHGSSH